MLLAVRVFISKETREIRTGIVGDVCRSVDNRGQMRRKDHQNLSLSLRLAKGSLNVTNFLGIELAEGECTG